MTSENALCFRTMQASGYQNFGPIASEFPFARENWFAVICVRQRCVIVAHSCRASWSVRDWFTSILSPVFLPYSHDFNVAWSNRSFPPPQIILSFIFLRIFACVHTFWRNNCIAVSISRKLQNNKQINARMLLNKILRSYQTRRSTGKRNVTVKTPAFPEVFRICDGELQIF